MEKKKGSGTEIRRITEDANAKLLEEQKSQAGMLATTTIERSNKEANARIISSFSLSTSPTLLLFFT